MDSLLGQEFETMAKARDAIKETIIDAGLSYKTLKSRTICYILVYKDNTCNNFSFIILYFLLVLTKNRPFSTAYFIFTTACIARITIYTPHTCFIITHTNFQYSNAISYTFPHHINVISQDRTLKPKNIANQERLQHSN
jgi:hypothetical protein